MQEKLIDLLDFENAWNQTTGNGWLTKPEALLLWNSAVKEVGPILEVGCYEGKSTCILAKLQRVLYAVDPFDGFHSERSGDEICKVFFDNIQQRQLDNVSLYRCKIEDWQPKEIGFAYLDGDHTLLGTLYQIEKAIKCGAKSICIHDYAEDGGGLNVKQAIQETPVTLQEVVERMAYCTVNNPL